MEKSLQYSQSDIATALKALNNAGITYENQFQLLTAMDITRPSATLWTDLYYAALDIFNTRLKDLGIKDLSFIPLAQKLQTPKEKNLLKE